jgi:hypothetical protein
MKTTLFYLITCAAVIAALSQPSCSGCDNKTDLVVNPALAPSLTWNVPVDLPDSPATQAQFTMFGWQSFIALNWPARLDQRGLPDTSKAFGANWPTVWETFKNKQQTFPSNASDPGPWNATGQNFMIKRLGSFSKISNPFVIPVDTDGVNTGGFPDEFDQADGSYPLIDQDSNYVTYEILVNQSEYEYVRSTGYYNGYNQKVDVSDSAFVIPPKGPNSDADTALMRTLPVQARYGATELKAAWRVIPKDMPASQKARYFKRPAIRDLPGGLTDTVELGLVGLHILRLTRSTHNTWFWATFEHVDNDTIMPSYGGTPPPTPTFNPGPNGTPAPPYPAGFCYNTTNCDSTGLPPQITATQQGLPALPPVNVSRITPIDQLVDSLNLVYKTLFNGTVWQYYRMVGVLNQVPTGNSNTAVPNAPGVFVNAFPLPNITMETYAQVNYPSNENPTTAFASNCVTCHGFGFPQYFDADKAYARQEYQIFTFLLGDAASDSLVARKPRFKRIGEAEKPRK